jgi:hypothetical protein
MQKVKIGEDGKAKHKAAIRVIPVKVLHVQDPAAYDRWQTAAVQIQRAMNRIWLALLIHHEKQGSGPKIRKWIEELRQRGRNGSKKGKAPPCPVSAIPKELMQSFAQFIRKDCPDINSRCVTLAVNKETKDLCKHKGSVGAFKRWHYVVAGLGDTPVYSRPQPIPIDRQNAKLIPPWDEQRGEEKEWVFQMRLDCFEAKTKRGTKKSASHLDEVILATKGKRAGKVRRILEKIARGEVKFCGSSLELKRKGGWYINLCYQEPQEEPAKLDPASVAWFAPARKHPWNLLVPRMNGTAKRRYWIGGVGRVVQWVRRQVFGEKRTRSESYKFASNARKGHGRKRAEYDGRNRLANHKKTYNEQCTTHVVQFLADRGIGTLKFVSPSGKLESTRFLVRAGTTAKRPDSWPWFQVKAMLERKCERAGIKLEVV